MLTFGISAQLKYILQIRVWIEVPIRAQDESMNLNVTQYVNVITKLSDPTPLNRH